MNINTFIHTLNIQVLLCACVEGINDLKGKSEEDTTKKEETFNESEVFTYTNVQYTYTYICIYALKIFY